MSLLELRALASEIHWLPVVQGQTLNDYVGHLEIYDRVGVDLRKENLVGIGSICRRNRTGEAGAVFRLLNWYGLRMHGFGVKAEGLLKNKKHIMSADSMAWSLRGRREDGDRMCRGEKRLGLANSQEFAESWRAKMLLLLDCPETAANGRNLTAPVIALRHAASPSARTSSAEPAVITTPTAGAAEGTPTTAEV